MFALFHFPDSLGKQGYNACVAYLQPYQTFHTKPFFQQLLMIINPRGWPYNNLMFIPGSP